MENEVKEPAPKFNDVSPEQYLEMERASREKHEYYKGEVYAISGASPEHKDIAYNINRLIAPFLHGKGCKLYGSDFRIYIPDNLLYTYPDFSIVCGQTETPDVYTDNLTNPTVIIEIFSASTKDYDRGKKFHLYRSIKTLQEYILIDSTSICIEVYLRQADNSWRLTEFNQPIDSFPVTSFNLTLQLKDIYEDLRIEQ
ncbi:MAG TPA: Uma2 family endonuclease [Chitinophagaceae bacterium]|nr:Uma2 family endonuclease [Chitinophagaceae bacterium]